jgi:shikimate dehydrogenase
MNPNNHHAPISEKSIKNSEIVMDVVASPINTRLIQFSKKHNISTVNGFDLAFYQACEQFKLYTGRNPPINIMRNAGIKLMKDK